MLTNLVTVAFGIWGVRLQHASNVLVGRDRDGHRAARSFLFAAWLVLVGWFWWNHVVWRDEVRAFNLALSGSNVFEMLRNIHGEGHPATWYLLLRGAHALFPYKQVLPVLGGLIGVATMAVFALRAPFRLFVIALTLFSLWAAYEFVVVARNYGMSALVMFVLAAVYQRVRNTPWFGVILLVLCNTNVPSCFLAAAFLLFRFIEMLTDRVKPAGRDWVVFAMNAGLSALGALLCFLVIYPPANPQAVSGHLTHFSLTDFVRDWVDSQVGFATLAMSPLVLFVVCLGFIRRPAALVSALVCLFGMKLFFYTVYPSAYRHEMLFLVFIISLWWMIANGAGGQWAEKKWMNFVESVGAMFLVALLLVQTFLLTFPLRIHLEGTPYSRSADAARVLKQPALSRAIVMADFDTLLEPLPYYVDNPLWFARQKRFTNMIWATAPDRHFLTLDDLLGDADRLSRESGRPVVILSHSKLYPAAHGRFRGLYHDRMVVDSVGVDHFLASTMRIARLRKAVTDEDYDVYLYRGSGKQPAKAIASAK